MSYEEYSATQHPTPYSFHIAYPKAHLFYFGATHSFNQENEQYPLLKNFWQEFLTVTGGKESIVLVEGNVCPVKVTAADAIGTGAEGGFITFLASEQSIPIECPEPSRHDLINVLSKDFSQEEIIYTFAAQGIVQAHRASKQRKNFSIEKYVEDYLKIYQPHFKIPLSIDLVEDIHESLFAQSFDLTDETFFYSITNPARNGSIINKVCRKKSTLRDAHIVSYIHVLLKETKHVFVVFGFTHAIMQEKALRSLDLEAPSDQLIECTTDSCSDIFSIPLTIQSLSI